MPTVVRTTAVWMTLLLALAVGVFSGCATETADNVVASVEGEAIYESELEEFLKLIYLYMPDTEEIYAQDEYREDLKSEVTWFLIENRVLQNEANKLGMETDEEKLEEHYEQVREELVRSVYGTEEAYLGRLEELGLEEETLKKLHDDTQLREILYEHISDTVTEQDARDFVKQNPSFLEVPGQAHTYHILLESEEEAREVRQLLEEGADFMELGKERSLDEHVDLGRISSRDMLHPTFLNAAFDLLPGEISEPVETPFGYHIIKVTEKAEAETLSFEEVKEDALEAKRRMVFEEYIYDLVADAEIDYLLDNGENE